MPYTPKPPPRTKPEFQDLYDYIEQELQSISRTLLETSELELRTTNSAPIRPREGMIVQADGTNWDPGEGAGTYKYEAGNWVRFGDADHVHTLADITDAGLLAGADEVLLGDMADLANQRVIGRNTAGTGVPESVSLTQLLDWIGSAAQGDLLVRGASAWARLAKGSASQVLAMNSGGTDPEWAANPSPWTEFSSQSASSSSNIDFTDIPQTGKVLLFLLTDVDSSTSPVNLVFSVGTTSSFGSLRSLIYGAAGGANGGSLGIGASSATSFSVGPCATDATTFHAMLIFDYASTTKRKIAVSFHVRKTTAYMQLNIFTIDTTSAIEHVRFAPSSGNFVTGSFVGIRLF